MGRSRTAAARILKIKAGLPPVVCSDALILILGSLPGDASLTAKQYYAHPRNQFWSLLSYVTRQDLAVLEYDARITALKSAKIALWDVVAQANRRGSLDHQIRNVQLNDLCNLLIQMPKLRVIAFNGKKAAVLAGNAVCGMAIDVLHLPSSSPANTQDIEAKKAMWVGLARYLATDKTQALPHAPDMPI